MPWQQALLAGNPPSATLSRLYAGLPDVYRDADEDQGGAPGHDYPLLRFLACLTEPVGSFADKDVLLSRIAYVAPDEGGPATGPGSTSDLVNPNTADPSWLRWLAQCVGIQLAPGLTVADQRNAIAGALLGWRVGTVDAIRAAAQTVLTGGRSVTVYDHAGGDFWSIGVQTVSTETASDAAVAAAIANAGAKPAGFRIVVTHYAATWATETTAYPTWAGRNNLTWSQLQSVGHP